jgi:hypothetical protein
VIGEDFRAFCGGVFCKSQDRKPRWLAGETLARMNCGRSGIGIQARDAAGFEMKGANGEARDSRAAPAFSNPTRIMDTAKWTTPNLSPTTSCTSARRRQPSVASKPREQARRSRVLVLPSTPVSPVLSNGRASRRSSPRPKEAPSLAAFGAASRHLAPPAQFACRPQYWGF